MKEEEEKKENDHHQFSSSVSHLHLPSHDKSNKEL